MSALSPPLPDATQLFRIIHIDDEEWLLEIVEQTIRANQAFKNVIIKTFQNRDEALRELFHNTDPNLLITDLRNDNVPGRTEHFGMSGLEMLSVLAATNVKYPVLVFSGSLSIEGYESKARQIAGNKINISFLQKPATSEQLNFEISKHLGLNKAYAPKNVQYRDVNLTKEQQAYFDEVVARAGKPSAEVQAQIDRIRAAKSQDELTEIFSRDTNVIRPKIEAELLVAFMLAKQAELKPSINAKKLEEENRISKENGKAEPKQKQPTPLASKSNQDQGTQKKSFITFKRCLIGGIWACVICGIGNGVDSSSSWFFTVPAAGLPWLIFKISDNEATGERMETGEAIGILLMGAMLSLFSGLPVLIAFVFLRNVFASH